MEISCVGFSQGLRFVLMALLSFSRHWVAKGYSQQHRVDYSNLTGCNCSSPANITHSIVNIEVPYSVELMVI
jgi:hypothetical protein